MITRDVLSLMGIHHEDLDLLTWAVENGWHPIMSPQGITMITRPGLNLAFAVEPRLTELGTAVISKEKEAAPAQPVNDNESGGRP